MAESEERALRTEYCLAQVKEELAEFYKACKEERNQAKQPTENNRRFQGRGPNNHFGQDNRNNNNNNNHKNNRQNNNNLTKMGTHGGNQ